LMSALLMLLFLFIDLFVHITIVCRFYLFIFYKYENLSILKINI